MSTQYYHQFLLYAQLCGRQFYNSNSREIFVDAERVAIGLGFKNPKKIIKKLSKENRVKFCFGNKNEKNEKNKKIKKKRKKKNKKNETKKKNKS